MLIKTGIEIKKTNKKNEEKVLAFIIDIYLCLYQSKLVRIKSAIHI
jgi:hypothetical protein